MDNQIINELMHMAEQVINQTHYSRLSQLEILSLDETSKNIQAEDVLCLFRISEIVYDDKEEDFDRFSVVFNALHACGASCIMILTCVEGRSDLYIGAVNKQKYENIYYLNLIRDILKTSIYGNLPGSEIQEVLTRRDIRKVLKNTLDNGFDTQCITAVSSAIDMENPGISAKQGIETLLGAVRECNFSLIVMADPVSGEQIEEVKKGYENLGTNLSALENTSVSMQTGNNYTTSESTSTSINESLTRGISMTQVHSVTGVYKKATEEKDDAETVKALVKLGMKALSLMSGEKKDEKTVKAMQAVGQIVEAALQFKNTAADIIPKKETALTVKPEEVTELEQQTKQYYGSAPESLSSVKGQQQGMNLNQQIGKAEQAGKGSSVTETKSSTIQKTTRDLHIAGLNERILRYLKWLDKSKNYGMFNCCTYIVSGSASTNLIVAGQYQALLQSYGQSEQPVSINTWTKENGVEGIRDSLMHFVHPTFESSSGESSFSTAMLLSSKELAKQMALPRRSIFGVSVANHASFGMEVVRKSSFFNGSLIRLGEIQHMSKSTGQSVLLDLQSLSSHTFIAGTNGSGKSNTVFKILEELQRLKLPFMVIEPAKGEYKNRFGNDHGVTVLGTNPKKTKLLNINPFWFNDDVMVYEHIDKLIEIFNASWSMSAAMPAVLKASIENAYKAMGWNLKTSECLGVKRFPTVKDVLGEFHNKMRETAFSQEVKGNYIGALSTRMESLCNGIYGEIFMGENIEDEALFNDNVIIDLSRVGSSETKAMIMGLLIIRLQEYRMKHESLNLPLQHIMVLEEAHHLLRRTSTIQSDEGTNLLGKSVEMISNMIAEMRSFGEGFLIVDQSPGLLDISVIRNTNTKIIMRLLENSDRELVGNSMGLTSEQKVELSRLKTGVCAVYQKEWLEPVLCFVDKAYHKERIWQYAPAIVHSDVSCSLEKARGKAFEMLTPLYAEKTCSIDAADAASAILNTSDDTDRKLASLLSKYRKTGVSRIKGVIEPYASIIWTLLDGDNVWQYVFTLISANDITVFDSQMREQINKKIDCSTDTQTALISLFLQKKGAIPQVRDFYPKWAWKYMLNK